ncbi:LuxR C-terminal-related transcriptional regulator [Bosea sp. 2YAB26]|uniref:LuxR C-terminal-related transcriptional regulator n=1 Tax=Bosea sp. 2YAB26 TaxID=3237478 RepID=UPI003F91758B
MALSGEPLVRVFLADEHPIFLVGLHSCLQGNPCIEIVGKTNKVGQLIDAVNGAMPDVLIVSASFNGVSAMEALLMSVPYLRVIVLVDQAEAAQARHMLALGVRGFVFRQSPIQILPKAIAAVRRGEYFNDAADAQTREHIAFERINGSSIQATLTSREREVLRLIALGFSVREAADNLGIAAKSAETYKARASMKLGIDNRRKIVQYAIIQGWFQ